jgi:uncharacterized protein YdaU (DUF1376 family)
MKDVPYFPCYAANILSSRSYRLMSLSERGLWISIWMECWINGGVPANFKEMAKILNFPEDEVRHAFSSLHSTFIHEESGQYISKELNEYRSGYEERREKQRLGGIKGSERKKEKRAKMERIEAVPQGVPKGVPKGSLSYINSNSVTSNQLINKEVLVQSNDEWVMDYENTPDAGEYVRHSRGS